MIRSHLTPAALALVAGLAGCASRATMDARYDASLQRWKGVSRAELLAAWGPPLLAAQAGDTETLTWTMNDDVHNTQSMPTYTSPSTGSPTVGVATFAPTVPMRCTTRFQVRAGVVQSWTFDGLACGAPAQ